MREKSLIAAYVFWLILGIFGAHRFYLGDIKMGVLYLLTAGLLGIGWLVDAFLIPGYVREHNLDVEDERLDMEDRIEELEDEVDYLNEKLAAAERRDRRLEPGR